MNLKLDLNPVKIKKKKKPLNSKDNNFRSTFSFETLFLRLFQHDLPRYRHLVLLIYLDKRHDSWKNHSKNSRHFN